jgi:hypothetical protein
MKGYIIYDNCFYDEETFLQAIRNGINRIFDWACREEHEKRLIRQLQHENLFEPQRRNNLDINYGKQI